MELVFIPFITLDFLLSDFCPPPKCRLAVDLVAGFLESSKK